MFHLRFMYTQHYLTYFDGRSRNINNLILIGNLRPNHKSSKL